jgi:hypothetical protein
MSIFLMFDKNFLLFTVAQISGMERILHRSQFWRASLMKKPCL